MELLHATNVYKKQKISYEQMLESKAIAQSKKSNKY